MVPRVSIIVPIYKGELYIRQCIDSILNQTYRDFELILINDGSPDNSINICNDYANRDSRVRVFDKENEGVSVTRNFGIEISRGEFITFVDCDDYIDDTFLENGILGMGNNDVDLWVSGLYMEEYFNNDIISSIEYSGFKKIYSVKSLLESLNKDYPLICISGPWCKFYKRSILKKYNIVFDKNLSLGEDTDFNLDYLKACNKISFSNKIFYHYRRLSNESLFSKYHSNFYEIHVKIFDKMRDLFYQNKCNDASTLEFEVMYTNLMIGCIHKEFNFKESSKSKRKMVIKKIGENSNINLSYLLDKKNYILVFLLKLKCYNLLYLIFRIRYKRYQ